jgi:hypothetical protein
MKSERLQKLEMELEVNVSCMAAGLYPPREKERYLEEIRFIETKILDEKERLRFMKENGDDQEYVIPKRNPRPGYAEPHTLPDMDAGDMTDGGDLETDHFGGMTDTGGDDDTDSEGGDDNTDEDEETDDEDMFSPGKRAARLHHSDELWEE